jgi:hypothetical protein
MTLTLDNQAQSTFKGSVNNMAITKQAIAEKYGEVEAQKYDPRGNCFTERLWKKRGFKVKKGEEPIARIPTLKRFSNRDSGTGEVSVSGARPASAKLYYILQVEPVK